MQSYAIAAVASGKFPAPDGRKFDQPRRDFSLTMAEVFRALATNHIIRTLESGIQ